MSLFIISIFINFFSSNSFFGFFLTIFFLMFLNSVKHEIISSALLSFAGLIIVFGIFLIANNFFFIGLLLTMIYAGAILVLILFILILINQNNFKLVKEDYYNKQDFSLIDIYIIIFLIILYKLISKYNLLFVNLIQNQNLQFSEISSNFLYLFSKNELYNLSYFLLNYNSSILYILGIFISICSILILALIRKLY